MAQKAGHTAGPWDYFVGNANGRGLIRIEAGNESEDAGHHIASMPRGEVSEANARLIAAAPDLVEALKKARIAIATWSPNPTEPLEEIEDALLKAGAL